MTQKLTLEKFNDFMAVHGITWDDGRPHRLDILPGWVPLVQKTLLQMKQAGWDGELHAVRQKLGSLRIYTGKTTRRIDEITAQALKNSWHVCEVCGEDAKLVKAGKEGWIITACHDHEDGVQARELLKKIPRVVDPVGITIVPINAKVDLRF